MFLLEDIQQKHPDLTTDEQQIKVTEVLRNQFLAHHDQGDSEKASSSDHPCGQDNKFHVLAGESQDHDDCGSVRSDTSMDDPSAADLWDAIIQLQSEKILKAKAKLNGLDDI